MTELLGNIALVAAVVAFMLGFAMTAATGAVKPVKIVLAVLTGVFVSGFVAGLIFSRGLLIYLLFQIIALIILWYFMVIIGAVCGGGVYLLLHRKTPGSNLDNANLDDYLPAAEFASREGITEERALARIRSGYYQGGLHQHAWYIHKAELSHNNNQRGTA